MHPAPGGLRGQGRSAKVGRVIFSVLRILRQFHGDGPVGMRDGTLLAETLASLDCGRHTGAWFAFSIVALWVE